jgi:competence ComEA-like helix-hairpin-helix protein
MTKISFNSPPGLIAATAVIGIGLHFSSAQTKTNTPDNYPWPDGPGKAVVKRSCLSCHSSSVIVAKPGRSADDWGDVLSKMVGRGAVISDDDADVLIDYLSTHFGPNWKDAPAAKPTPSPASENSRSPQASSPPPAPANTVNVNTVSAEELESSLGLTQTEAELITRHREQFGPFKTWQQVASIAGVPAEKIKENQKRLVF